MKAECTVDGAGQFTSWAAAWSPDVTAPRGFRYPIDLDTGWADDKVLGQWVAKPPRGLIRDPAVLARMKNDLSSKVAVRGESLARGQHRDDGEEEPGEECDNAKADGAAVPRRPAGSRPCAKVVSPI